MLKHFITHTQASKRAGPVRQWAYLCLSVCLSVCLYGFPHDFYKEFTTRSSGRAQTSTNLFNLRSVSLSLAGLNCNNYSFLAFANSCFLKRRQRADERFGGPSPKVDPGAFSGQRQGWKTPRGPSDSALLKWKWKWECTVGRSPWG